MKKVDDRALLAQLANNKTTEPVRILIAVLEARLEKYKDTLIARSCEQTRGKAQEVKDLLKALDRER